jgi:uncharacterized membrane protein YuzA (DUF378 family)
MIEGGGMRDRIIKTAFPVATLIISIVWIIVGFFIYDVWDPLKGPQKSFFPIIIASVMLIASLFAIVQAVKGKTPLFRKEETPMIFGALFIFLFTFVIGMLPALLFFCIGWLRCFERYSWKTTLFIIGILSAVVYGVFVFWLTVRFPLGLFEFLQ